MKKLIILYFIEGAVATKTQLAEAATLNGTVRFRNALKIVEGDSIENCDGVAGAVPKAYAKKFDTAKQAMKKREDALAKAIKEAGEEEAPKSEKPAKKAETKAAKEPAKEPAKTDPKAGAGPADGKGAAWGEKS